MRPALIADDDNDEGIEIVREKPPKKEKPKPLPAAIEEMGCREHLKTKQQIEELRKEYGDEWLHNQGASKVQDVMGIQLPKKTSTQTTEEKLENLFGLESTSTINRDRTSTPIQQSKHADFGHSPIDVRILSNPIVERTFLKTFYFSFFFTNSNSNHQFHRRATSRVSRIVNRIQKRFGVQKIRQAWTIHCSNQPQAMTRI